MKKLTIIALALSLGLFTAVHALAQSGEIVVDRSTKDKLLKNYTLLTRDAIQKVWTMPALMDGPDAVKGRVSISYSIARDGSVRSVKLLKGSGNREMDRSLMDAIRSAAPFPAFPDEIEARSVLIRANFVVAELPTIPVILANHDIGDGPRPVETEPDRSPKKFIWGVPAGSSDMKAANSEDPETAPVPPKKYRWGLDK